MSPASPPTSPELRSLIDRTIRHGSDLDAFLRDYFPEVAQRVMSDMDRTQRVTLLLTEYQGRLGSVGEALRQAFPAAFLDAGPLGNETHDDPIRRRVLLHHQTEALDLDRYVQWQTLLARVRRPGHELVLLPGERGQGHAYFMMRIELSLPNDPPRTIVSVSWNRQPVPGSKKDLFSDLAQALGCPADPIALRGELQRRLSQRNLILLHPLLREGFEEKSLQKYYGEWLPELLSDANPSGSVKIVQPIEWALASRWARLATAVLGWLPSEPRPFMRRARQAKRAQKLIADLLAQSCATLPVFRLRDLDQIQRAHIFEFCDALGLARAQQAEFVDSVLSGAKTASDILQNIGDYLPHYRQPK